MKTLFARIIAAVFALTALSGAAAGASSDFGFTVSDQQAISMVVSIHLQNLSGKTLTNIEVAAYLPRNLVGQTIYSLDFIPKPRSIETDKWQQKFARWKIRKLQPQEHAFVLWIARTASSEVTYDLDRLRTENLPIPLPIRSLYLWSGINGIPSEELYIDRYRRLADYVFQTTPQDHNSPAFPLAISRPGTSFEYAETMTSLCYTNDLPCRTTLGYVKPLMSGFSIDTTGSAWNEVYFPQSGWVPVDVANQRTIGKKPNDRIAVFASGYEPTQAGTAGRDTHFWGWTTGAGEMVRTTSRCYFSPTRDFLHESDLIKLFQSLAKETQPDLLTEQLWLQGQAGASLSLGLLEPYLYHEQPKVVGGAAAAIGAIRQSQAALMLVDALGQSPETDKIIIEKAETLTGSNFGTDKTAWRDYIRKNILP